MKFGRLPIVRPSTRRVSDVNVLIAPFEVNVASVWP